MKKAFSRIYTGICFAFLYIPILILIVFSFNTSKGATWTGFTTKWYVELFRNQAIISAFINTLIVALVASVFATILGTTAAFGMNSMKKMSKGVMRTLTYIQILNPEIVTGISLMLLFAYFKFTSGFATLILAHITFCVPTVVLSVLQTLPVVIYSMTKKQVTPTIYALSTLLFVGVLAVLIVYNLVDMRFENEKNKAAGLAKKA